MDIAFEPYHEARLAELLDLWVASWSEVYSDIDFNDRRQWLTEHIAGWIAHEGLCRIATIVTSGEMSGFVLIDARTGFLDQFCVSVACKGRGVAEALMAEARRVSPKAIVLGVNAMNHRAIRFYEREGFLKTGEGVNPRSGLPILHYRWQP